MKILFKKLFISDMTASFSATKTISDYIGMLTRLVFIVSITVFAVIPLLNSGPSFSLWFFIHIIFVIFLLFVSSLMYFSFAWLTAEISKTVLLGSSAPMKPATIIIAAIVAIVLVALPITIFQVAKNSPIVKDAWRIQTIG